MKCLASLAAQLATAKCEKDVENAYRAAIRAEFPQGVIDSPVHTDGILKNAGSGAHALLEFKFDLQYEKRFDKNDRAAAAVLQCLCYLRQLAARSEPSPKALLIGDRQFCFCLEVKGLEKYEARKIVNHKNASAAAKNNPELVKEIARDLQQGEPLPIPYRVDEHFDLRSVTERLKRMAQGKPYAVAITPVNLVGVFERFRETLDGRFVKAGKTDEAKRAKTAELANLFFDCLTAPDDIYLHPKRSGTLVTRGGEVRVKPDRFRAFWQEFRQAYTSEELEALTSRKDRVIEEEFRRRTGAFFTPDVWAAEARRMLAEQFGEDWKEKYVVWDCCCGTAQLTRGERFRELYLSTLDEGDVQTIRDMGYNPEAAVFQYDFLSEMGLGERVPQGLKSAFEAGRPVLVFANPPYGTSGAGHAGTAHKSGVAATVVNIAMKQKRLGLAARQLYTQFMFRAVELATVYPVHLGLAFFSKVAFLSSESDRPFRDLLCRSFEYRDGMMFQASEFADIAADWAVGFTLWEKKDVDG